jgi:hypothetical protein
MGTKTPCTSRADADKEVPDLPYVRRPRGLRATVTALLGAAAIFVVPAAAQAACAPEATTKAFAVFGDQSDYSLAPDGAFEAGSGDWSLTRAAVVNGSESFAVHAAGDSKSLAIDPSGVAVSPPICVDVERPSFRFFARRTSGSWAVLNVKLRWQDAGGATHYTVVGSLNGFGTLWLPTASLDLSGALALWKQDDTISVRLVFDPENYGGGWAIDDVYVDPYAKG